MIAYSDKVIVSGMPSERCISSLLYASDIGSHTSILFLNNSKRGKDTVEVKSYVWEHEGKRPNTHTLPVACPVCHAVHSWCPPSSVAREDGEPFVLQCLTKRLENGKTSVCRGSYEVGARPPGTLVKGLHIGRWHSCTVHKGTV